MYILKTKWTAYLNPRPEHLSKERASLNDFMISLLLRHAFFHFRFLPCFVIRLLIKSTFSLISIVSRQTGFRLLDIQLNPPLQLSLFLIFYTIFLIGLGISTIFTKCSVTKGVGIIDLWYALLYPGTNSNFGTIIG